MNINYKQPQFELFPANSAALEDAKKPRFLLANLTLSLESLVILSILGIMVALFSFCIGVERGKQLTAQAMDERVSAAWNVTVKKPLPKTFVPVAAAAVAAPAKPVKKGNAGYIAMAPKVQPVRTVVPAAMRLTLQLASYKNEAFARSEALALRAKGYPAFLIKRSDFVLVCVGQFANADAAAAVLKKLPPHYRASPLRRF